MNKKVFVLLAFVCLAVAGLTCAISSPEVGVVIPGVIKVTVNQGVAYDTEKNRDLTDDFYFRSPYDEPTRFKLEVEGVGAEYVSLAKTEITLNPGTKPYHVPVVINVPKSYTGTPIISFQITVAPVFEQTAGQGVGTSLDLRTGRIYEVTVSDLIVTSSPTPVPTIPQSTTTAVLVAQQTVTPTPVLSEQRFASNDEVNLTASIAKAGLDDKKLIASLVIIAIALYLGSNYYFKLKKTSVRQPYEASGLIQ